MIRRNAYEHLRMPEHVSVADDAVTIVFTIFGSADEAVLQYVAEASPGKWTYGYHITFQNGRIAEKRPGEIDGWFRSEKDAKLYFLGYMIQFNKYFSEDCIHEVKKQILSLIQLPLF